MFKSHQNGNDNDNPNAKPDSQPGLNPKPQTPAQPQE